MAAITPEEAGAYFRRWELVRDAEARELRRTPMETKLQQLASLMASRHVVGPEPNREADTWVVRERWARVRRALSRFGSGSGRTVRATPQTATNPESFDARASKVAVARHPRVR
jgi:hypothetical protein